MIRYELGSGSVRLDVIVCFDALALALLGPGAFSVDSYFFGRRVVVLPPESRFSSHPGPNLSCGPLYRGAMDSTFSGVRKDAFDIRIQPPDTA